MPKDIDWKTIGDTVCAILTAVYIDQREQFKREAKRQRITVEQLAAAAITCMIQETMDSRSE